MNNCTTPSSLLALGASHVSCVQVHDSHSSEARLILLSCGVAGTGKEASSNACASSSAALANELRCGRRERVHE